MFFVRWLDSDPERDRQIAAQREQMAAAEAEIAAEEFARASATFHAFKTATASELPSLDTSSWLILRPGEQCYATASATVEISLLHNYEKSVEGSIGFEVPHLPGIKGVKKTVDKFAIRETYALQHGTLLVLNKGVAFVSTGRVHLVPAPTIDRPVRDGRVVTLVLKDGNKKIPFTITGGPHADFLVQGAIERVARDAELNATA